MRRNHSKKKVSCAALAMRAIFIVIYTLTLASAKRADLLKGLSTESAGEHFTNDLPLDPTAKSAFFRHEGDMTFLDIPGEESNQQHRGKRNAVLNNRYIWPGGRIPYQIAPTFDDNERRVIFQAMKHWEDHTCIRFHSKRPEDVNSIYIMSAGYSECASYIGRLFFLYYRPQGVSLGPRCVFFPTIVHELGHAIGFYHEHNRADRDDYITIGSNVSPLLASQLERLISSNTLGLGYDYASIMHYGSFGGIITSRGSVPFGNAEELSPLDIEKAIRLYSGTCGRRETWSPPSITVPPSLSLPQGTTCGQIIKTDKSGSFQFPGHPSHAHNGDCSYVIEAPKGFGFDISFPNLQLGSSYRCTAEYMRLHIGASLSQDSVVYYVGYRYIGGRICSSQDSRTTFFVDSNVITVNYHTDGSNARALRVNYIVRDINECSSIHQCHHCTNFLGSYNCSCRDGYYHSPASNTCYDVNECAFNNGGCKGICLNSGGSYTCSCSSGSYIQADGVSCGRSRPAASPRPPTPGTIIPVVRPSTITTSTPSPTTPSPTPPTSPTTRLPPTPSRCGETLTASGGTLQTKNWPQVAYPIDTNCEWIITCPGANKLIDLTFDSNFRVAGQMPDCPKDKVEVVDCDGVKMHGPYCHLKAPEPITGLCNSARVFFTAGAKRGATRTGFSATYRCRDGPSLPPTTRPTTQPTTRPTTQPTTRPTTQPTTRPTTQPTTPPTTQPTTRPTSQPTFPPTPFIQSTTTSSGAINDSTTSQSCPLRVIPTTPSRSTCTAIIHPGTSFGLATFPQFVPPSTSINCNYILRGSQSSASYQVRIQHLDFPTSSNCEELSFAVYGELNSNGEPVLKLCGGETHCDELVIPLPRHRVVAWFKTNGNVNSTFRGFVAAFEEVA